MCSKILFSCCLLFGLLWSSIHAEEILIVTEEWAPYNYKKNGEVIGVSADIVKSIIEMLNKNYKIELLPSMRSTYVLKTRPLTMMFSMFRTPERESQYKWIGPLSDGSIYFYKKKDAGILIESLNDMKDDSLSICSRQAGLIHRLLINKGFKNLDDSAITGLQIYKKLIAGRCDFAISESDLGVRYILKSLELTLEDVFVRIPIPIFEADLYLVASKDIPDEEIQQWQSALDSMKANGVYEEIIKKYY